MPGGTRCASARRSATRGLAARRRALCTRGGAARAHERARQDMQLGAATERAAALVLLLVLLLRANPRTKRVVV